MSALCNGSYLTPSSIVIRLYPGSMHLQSLELFGFKSFADKTVFHFHEGITAVVGPNGCGKSNLLDAVRWVLGEQSAKSLRGSEMADVIFNGTDTRKPIGFAEVSLTLTDCTQELGVEWHDVRVTRRVYRDGNSEYFLNKTACRLRDIQALFADTGVARSAYSMMEQGRIDLILSSKPEDRRAVFEEAAGITKYKTQKREALRKLEATDANLLRIGDIIKEVKRQIGSLQRQAGKARRYQALLADLQVLDTSHSRRRLELLEMELKKSRGELERINDGENKVRQNIGHRENGVAETRQALDRLDLQIADARAELEHLQSDIGSHRNRIELNRQRAEEMADLIARFGAEIAAAEMKRSRQHSEMAEVSALLEKTARSLETKKQEVTRLTETIDRVRADRAAGEAESEELLLQSAKIDSRIAILEGELSNLTTRRDNTRERLGDLEKMIAGATAGESKAKAELAAGEESAETDQTNAVTLAEQTLAAEKALQDQRQSVTALEKALFAMERAVSEKQSRLEVLHQLNEEGEGLAQGSQAVLKGLDDPKTVAPVVAGALVAHLDVDAKFIAAIEAILGRNLHAIVVEDAKAVPQLINKLTADKLGQAALYVEGLARHEPAPASRPLPAGGLVWAIETVKSAGSISSLVRQLIGEVAIFPDLPTAISAKQSLPDLAVATLGGELISREGIVFGGASPVATESLLARKARISTLEEQLLESKSEREEIVRRRDEATSHIEQALAELETIRGQHRAAELAHSTSQHKIGFLQRQLEEARRNVEALTSEESILRQQVAAAGDRMAALEKELQESRTKSSAAAVDRERLERTRHEAMAEEEKVAQQLNDMRLEVATEQQRHDNLLAQREPMTEREVELAEIIATRRSEIESFEKRLVAQAEESKSAEGAIRDLEARRDQIKLSIADLGRERGKQLAELTSLESELRDARNELNELHDERASHQVRESQLQMKIDNLGEQMQQRYHVDLRSCMPDQVHFQKALHVQIKRSAERAEIAPNGDQTAEAVNATSTPPKSESATIPPLAVTDDDLEGLVTELRQQLENMGPVNLDAVQEYDELEERHRFLETQNADLTASRREVLDVIARINSTTRQMFVETFAQVRTNFREMFGELFGGGRADLSLLDEGDPLNCGIEISAKPPGKQLQSISLLSGGERTMTAVALLFAIYMVRPSPFCVLDELDAPLDESNINRFIRVLERFVAQSQFIIITHNKRTIAKADILYGVTMEERGVSKLVGMKLTDRRPGEQQSAPLSASQRQFALTENGHSEKQQSFAAR